MVLAKVRTGPALGRFFYKECVINNDGFPVLTRALGVCHNFCEISSLRRIMTPDERERMAILCQRIATEKDPESFDNLVQELNDLLEIKRKRIRPERGTKSI